MDYQPSVVQAVPGPEKTVYAYFSDGSVRLFDAAPLIAKGSRPQCWCKGRFA